MKAAYSEVYKGSGITTQPLSLFYWKIFMYKTRYHSHQPFRTCLWNEIHFTVSTFELLTFLFMYDHVLLMQGVPQHYDRAVKNLVPKLAK